MLSRGVDVRLLTRDHALEFGGDEEDFRASLEQRLRGAEPWLLTGRVRDPGAVPALAALLRLRRSFRPDVVHLQNGIGNDPRLLAVAAPPRRRYAFTVHDPTLHPGDEAPHRVSDWVDTRLIRKAGVVFVHADPLRDELIEHYRPDAPVEVVPHGMDPPEVAPLPAEPTLLFFGRISAYKGLDVLLDALPTLWSRVPAARLVVAGEGELPEHPALGDDRVLVRAEHIAEREVPELFRGATCVVLPYRHASQSGVGSVAKSHGRAMVASAIGGLPELVADGSGVLVPPESPAELADALGAVLSDPGQAAAMGRAGAASAAAGASWEDVAGLTVEAYRRHGLAR